MRSSKAAARDADRPYSIEVVPADRGWILEKIAAEIAREAERSPDRYRVHVIPSPSGSAELTLFLPESAWRDDLQDTIRVTYFAHKEDHPAAAALFEEVARKSDCCITSSSKYAKVLREDGAREVITIPLGVDTDTFVPKVRIGVIGRTYQTGRKGESLLAPSMDLPFVEFVFTGEGWPLPSHYYSERDLAELYQSLDYLLIPSLIEGGPVPMLEALAAGCRVIAPSDVGMVQDFPHIPFRRGDADDLRRVIRAEVDGRMSLRAAALPCDWRHFARRHLDLFAQLIERRRASRSTLVGAAGTAGQIACRALLVMHGPESAAKGGPTTRVNNIVAHLRSRGLAAEATDDPGAVATSRHDVIHVFNSWPPDSALAALAAARRSGAKVVFSPIALDLADWPLFHPFMERMFGSAPSQASLRATVEALRAATPARTRSGARPDVAIEGIHGLFEKLRMCCDLADRLIFLSEFERDYLTSIGARVDHGVVIRNGVDVEQMASADPELFRRRFNLDRYALCVGRLEYRKNQALAAMAMRDADVPLVLVGAAGDAGYVEHIRKLGGDMRLLARIDDRRLLASAYAGADAFVLPSWTEGAPLAAMEAGVAGAPLVLSGMSSEREYFGRDACYVHPADVDGIRDAVLDALARRESAPARAERAGRMRAQFSIARHADETWAAYERLLATDQDRASPPTVVDVSALLHFVRARQPFTGVPLVERSVLTELSRLVPMRCIVYNDVKDRFVEIDMHDLTDFDENRFNTLTWFSVDDAIGVDRRATLHFSDMSTPQPPDQESAPHALGKATPPRVKAVVMGKRMLQRLPPAARGPLVALARRWRPNFDPYRMPPGCGVEGKWPYTACSTAVAPWRSEPVSSPSGEPRFEHALATLLVRDVPRYAPAVPAGARLLSLGQSWLSNGPLLDAMLRLTRTRVLSLEPYVYDLTYHTGAHLTGWDDNGDRFARLLALLRHSNCVFTASRQVESELRKLRASRDLRYVTRRTGLRGRDLSRVDPRVRSPYEPDTFVLVVSSFNKRKNHDFLVRVWSNLHETWIKPLGLPYRLVLAGQIQEERRYADPAFVRQLAQVNIDIRTDVSDDLLARMMRECAFTAYPSLQEGWGLPVQESLMCGKICLVSDSLPVAQEIANSALIRLAPNDFYGWFEALRTWLDNAPMRRAFEERAKEYVPASWREIAESIAGLRAP